MAWKTGCAYTITGSSPISRFAMLFLTRNAGKRAALFSYQHSLIILAILLITCKKAVKKQNQSLSSFNFPSTSFLSNNNNMRWLQYIMISVHLQKQIDPITLQCMYEIHV